MLSKYLDNKLVALVKNGRGPCQGLKTQAGSFGRNWLANWEPAKVFIEGGRLGVAFLVVVCRSMNTEECDGVEAVN